MNLEYELGQVRGLIVVLMESIKDDRRTTIDERREILIKLDRLEERMEQFEFKFDPIVNKSEEHDSDIAQLKLVHAKVAAVIGFFSTMGGILISGLWYVLTHWDEIFITVKQVFGGWK